MGEQRMVRSWENGQADLWRTKVMASIAPRDRLVITNIPATQPRIPAMVKPENMATRALHVKTMVTKIALTTDSTQA